MPIGENNKKDLARKKDLLKPKNDIVFQTLFTRGSEDITRAMIEDIIKIEINKIDLDRSKDLLNDDVSNKNGRLDIRAIYKWEHRL